MKNSRLFISFLLSLALLPGAVAAGAPQSQLSFDAPAQKAAPSYAPAARGEHVVRAGETFLMPLQKRDSILIADQLEYGVKLEGVEANTRYGFPELNDSTAKGILFVRPWQLDTLKVHKAKKNRPLTYDIKASTVLTTFDEGEYELSDLPVLRQTPDGVIDTLLFDSIRFKVTTMPVDTASFQVHDIKDVIHYPLTLKEVLPWVGLFYLLVAIAVAAACLVIMHRRRQLGAEEKKDPAHIVALRKLDSYRGDKLWAPEKQKTFWSGVTDVLREYIASRYEIGAMEMTSGEIFAELRPKFDSESADRRALLSDLQTLFETADYVKFAKHIASPEENAGVLPLAVKFVTQTYQDELSSETPATPEAPAEEPAEEKKEEAPAEAEKDNYDRYAPVPDDKEGE